MWDITVAQAHSFFVGSGSVLVHNACNVKAPVGPGKAENYKSWPDSPAQMDERLGQPGRPVPDGPTTAGRGKVEWDNPNGTGKITYEQHQYDMNAPDWHKGPHWHYDSPSRPHDRALPGDPWPFN